MGSQVLLVPGRARAHERERLLLDWRRAGDRCLLHRRCLVIFRLQYRHKPPPWSRVPERPVCRCALWGRMAAPSGRCARAVRRTIRQWPHRYHGVSNTHTHMGGAMPLPVRVGTPGRALRSQGGWLLGLSWPIRLPGKKQKERSVWESVALRYNRGYSSYQRLSYI